MTKTNKFESFTKFIPALFEEEDVFSAKFLNKIKNIVPFSAVHIFLLNSENLSLFYSSRKTMAKEIKISPKISGALFNENKPCIDEVKKLLGTKKNIFIVGLKTKGVVFGISVFENTSFAEEDKSILEGFSEILSYKIKDQELSKVFKSQLKTLSSAILETKNAEKIKTEFVANISHELRTPLNAIIGFSELLSNPKVGTLNPKQTDYVEDIRVSSLHLLGMINEVLDISKIEANSMQLSKTTFQISQAVTEVSNILHPLFEKKSLIFKTKLEKEIEINADYQKFQQIIFNLLSNAIKFTPNKGEIRLEAKQDNGFLKIKITDNGIGIAKKNQKKVFEKFTQLNDPSTKAESSTGLGLTITQEFVKLHNGTITLESKLKKGSTFTINLPLN